MKDPIKIVAVLVVSMPHAALWVVQREGLGTRRLQGCVSMPHAALWVVQQGEDYL